MSKDIAQAIEGWPFQPNEISVRLVRGDDDREKVQLRLDLGLLQMEVEGRPDGQRPHDCESLLEYFEAKQKQHDRANPDVAAFQLEPDDCEQLLREGIQYYHRYLSFWHLERYDSCARDTKRNLRLLKFIRKHARRDRDKLQFDRWRPYLLMMHARSLGTPLIEQERFNEALATIDEGIAQIRRFLEDYDQSEHADQCSELTQLLTWREEIVKLQAKEQGPSKDDPLFTLRSELKEAIDQEQFEEAARLRDEIHRLTGSGPGEKL